MSQPGAQARGLQIQDCLTAGLQMLRIARNKRQRLNLPPKLQPLDRHREHDLMRRPKGLRGTGVAPGSGAAALRQHALKVGIRRDKACPERL